MDEVFGCDFALPKKFDESYEVHSTNCGAAIRAKPKVGLRALG
jgi:hypothetical protein